MKTSSLIFILIYQQIRLKDKNRCSLSNNFMTNKVFISSVNRKYILKYSYCQTRKKQIKTCVEKSCFVVIVVVVLDQTCTRGTQIKKQSDFSSLFYFSLSHLSDLIIFNFIEGNDEDTLGNTYTIIFSRNSRKQFVEKSLTQRRKRYRVWEV